jgi:hypothetical protein
MHDPFFGFLDRRLIRISIPLYAYAPVAGASSYSFVSTSSSQSYSLSTAMIGTTEFTDLYKEFAMMRIVGAELEVSNTQNFANANIFTSLPTLALDIIPYFSSLQTYSGYQADTALLVSPMNTAKLSRKYYPFNGVIQTSAGYPICGSSAWLVPYTYSASNQLYLVCGFGTPPINTASGNVQVANVDITFVIDFAKPIRIA